LLFKLNRIAISGTLDKDRLIEYVKNQEKRHSSVSFRDELVELLKEQGIEFDEKYLL